MFLFYRLPDCDCHEMWSKKRKREKQHGNNHSKHEVSAAGESANVSSKASSNAVDSTVKATYSKVCIVGLYLTIMSLLVTKLVFKRKYYFLDF